MCPSAILPQESSFPPIKVVVTVFLEEIAQPGVLTLSGLSKATTLKGSRDGFSATIHNHSSLSLLYTQPHSQPSPLFRPCSVSNQASCGHWVSPSTSPAGTSPTLMQFTSSATPSKPKVTYIAIFLVALFLILRKIPELA